MHDSSKEHFFALKVVEGILTKLDGDMMQDLSLSDGRQMHQDPVFTFFQVQQLTRVPFTCLLQLVVMVVCARSLVQTQRIQSPVLLAL